MVPIIQYNPHLDSIFWASLQTKDRRRRRQISKMMIVREQNESDCLPACLCVKYVMSTFVGTLPGEDFPGERSGNVNR